MKAPGNRMRCDSCGSTWNRRTGNYRREYVAVALGVLPCQVDEEDIAIFGDDCPNCGDVGAPLAYRRVWR